MPLKDYSGLTKAMVKNLNRSLESEYYALARFEAALEMLPPGDEGAAARKILESIIADEKKHVRMIVDEIKEKGGEPVEKPEKPAGAAEEGDLPQHLGASLRGQERIIENYKTAIARTQDDATKAMYEKMLDDEGHTRQRILKVITKLRCRECLI